MYAHLILCFESFRVGEAVYSLSQEKLHSKASFLMKSNESIANSLWSIEQTTFADVSCTSADDCLIIFHPVPLPYGADKSNCEDPMSQKRQN